jgi:tetratricopeptide (TPR) repeat protein
MTLRRFLSAAGMAGLLAQLACAPAGYQKSEVVSERATTLAMASEIWQQSDIESLPAVDDLVRQADAQIASRKLDMAAEKLERALRISPDYAPAWSRLAHIALAEADPGRAIQMARRSNSHAGDSVELKLLNWEYIRKASQMLGDVEGARNASESINTLRSL